jgi:hypothetical protein
MSRTERLTTAHHEAGHAVAHILLSLPLEIAIISTDTTGYCEGSFTPAEMKENARTEANASDFMEREAISLACGIRAQRNKFPYSPSIERVRSAAGDRQRHRR